MKTLMVICGRGTVRDGLFEFKETYIRTYTDCALGKGNGLSDRVVNCIFRGADGKLWIGTDGGGINELNPVTGVFTHHLNTYNDKIVSITDLSAVRFVSLSLWAWIVRLSHAEPYV